MVNILVPTDFSDLSKVAIDYAIKVANKLGGNITLLHVVTVIQPTRASMRLRLEALEEELMQMAKEDMKALITEFAGKNKTDKPIAFEIIQASSFNAAVKSVAKKLRSGLIIMGTRGANGLKKVVLGSNTASVIESSNIPVLVVPEFAEFSSFKTVVYATDLKHLDDELELLIPYVKIFDSALHVFHVTSNSNEIGNAENVIRKALEKTGYKKFTIKIVVAKEIDHAVENYVKEAKSDLLTTFAHEHSFYEKLFDRSLTRKLAFQSKLPLLAFREN
jgi:nucleotide-binding universal stress UspA family protein